MKLSLFRVAALSMALAAVAAACADSDNTDSLPPSEDGGPPTTLPEAGPATDASVEAAPVEAGNQICSDAGWCATNPPGPGTAIQDIWPLEKHAFAVALSTTTVLSGGSLKILEWDEEKQQWGYIDDDSQNAISGLQGGFGNIWAPNDDEVYFAVTNVTSDILFHGQRPVAPSTTWTWTQTAFNCPIPGLDSPQVWGTSATDIYFWGCQTIFHKQAVADAGADDAGDSGVAGWTKEFSDPTSAISSIAITGTGPDDIWFVGTRSDFFTWFFGGGCTTIVRKTAAGYHVVADAANDGACGKVGNLPVVSGVLATFSGQGSAFAPSKGELIGVVRSLQTPGNYMVKVDTDDTDGGTTVTLGAPPPLYYLNDSWGTAGTTPFALGQISSSTTFVLRGPDSWDDAGTYKLSTLVRNSTPNLSQLNRIRGSSITNIWAVGDDNAYHKTTNP